MGGWNWNQIDLDHIDFQYPWIEQLIKLAAQAMGTGASQDEVVQLLKDRGTADSDIFLIMKGAELLYKDRTEAPPKKTLIKRI